MTGRMTNVGHEGAIMPISGSPGGQSKIKRSASRLDDRLEFLRPLDADRAYNLRENPAAHPSPSGEALLGIKIQQSDDELLLDQITGKVCRDGRFPNSSFLLNDCDHRHGELGYRFSENLERGFLFCCLANWFSENRKAS